MNRLDTRVHVTITAGPDAGRSARIDPSTFVVGSGEHANFLLNDDGVSAEHLELSLDTDGVRVRDLGSDNGTWMGSLRINDIVLTQTTALVVGRTTLSVSIGGAKRTLPPSANGSFGGAVGESPSMRQIFTVQTYQQRRSSRRKTRWHRQGHLSPHARPPSRALVPR